MTLAAIRLSLAGLGEAAAGALAAALLNLSSASGTSDLFTVVSTGG